MKKQISPKKLVVRIDRIRELVTEGLRDVGAGQAPRTGSCESCSCVCGGFGGSGPT